MVTIAGLVLSLALKQSAPSLGDAYFYFLQGRMLEGQGDVPGAIAAYRRAVEIQPKSAAVHSELAGLYARAGRLADAITEGSAAIALDKDDREAHRILGLVQASIAENQRDPAQQRAMMTTAISHLEQALAGARDPGAELTLGRMDLRMSRLPKAIEVLKNFLYDNPGYPEALMLLAEAYETNGQTNEAIEILAPLAGGPGAQPDAQMALAGLYEQTNRWKEAAAVWAVLAVKDPSYRTQQISALMNANDAVGARAVLSALTKDRPRDIDAWYLVAQTERRLGNARAAEDAAKKIAEIDPGDARGPLAMAESKEAARDFAAVVTVLQPLFDERLAKPRANDEVFSLAGMMLSNAHQNLKQFDRAETVMRALIARDASDDTALNALGYMLADRGQKLDEALAFVKRAVAIDGTNPSYLDSLGWVYFKQGKADEAVAPLERAVKAAPASSLLQEHLGDVFVALKRYREAADAYGRALSGDRDGTDVAAVTKKRDRARDMAK